MAFFIVVGGSGAKSLGMDEGVWCIDRYESAIAVVGLAVVVVAERRGGVRGTIRVEPIWALTFAKKLRTLGSLEALSLAVAEDINSANSFCVIALRMRKFLEALEERPPMGRRPLDDFDFAGAADALCWALEEVAGIELLEG